MEITEAAWYVWFLERWGLPPVAGGVDDQPIDFLRWAPGIAAAWDRVNEDRMRARYEADRADAERRSGPRYGGPM